MCVQEVQSDGLLTQKSDVFSFGVLLWELYNCSACYQRTNAGFHIRCAAFPRFPLSCPLPFAILAVACLNPEPASRCAPLSEAIVLRFLSHLAGQSIRYTSHVRETQP